MTSAENIEEAIKMLASFSAKVFVKWIVHLSVEKALKLLVSYATIKNIIQCIFEQNITPFTYIILGGNSALLGKLFISTLADIFQLVLESCGYKKEAKIVGGLGNAAGGAVAGFIQAGPTEAVIGAAAGYGVWNAGENVGDVAVHVYRKICQSFIARMQPNLAEMQSNLAVMQPNLAVMQPNLTVIATQPRGKVTITKFLIRMIIMNIIISSTTKFN